MALYEDKGGQLVPTGGVPNEAVAAIERADDEAIVEHLTTSPITEEYLYSYEIGGKPVVGISVSGAKEIARELGNIEVLPDFKLDKDSDPDYIYATMRARDLTRNTILAGFGRQCKYYVTGGNVPTNRINEHAFVIALSKAQRNAILSVAPQEAIMRIVQTFMEQKKLKRLLPTYGPAPAKTAKVGTAEDTLKKLRQQVGIEAGKVFKTDEERKAWQKTEYNVDSMTQLDEGQLKDMLDKVKQMAAPSKAVTPPKPTPEELGFSSTAEQTQMRKELFSLMTGLGLKTDAEKANYAAQKGWGKTTEVTKEKLSEYIDEVKQAEALVKDAESIPENI